MIRFIRTLVTVPVRYGYATIRDVTGQSYLVPYSSVDDMDAEDLKKIIGDLTAKEYNRTRMHIESEFKIKYGEDIKLYPAEPIHRQLD